MGSDVGSGDDSSIELDRAKKERDFYRKLVALSAEEELGPLLADALGLIVEVAGATRGYIELSDGRDAEGPPRFWLAHGCSDEDVATIRGRISTSVMARAIATGETVRAASAQTDPRFMGRGSVRRNNIKAVLCAPIGSSPPVGVVYLQDQIDGESFDEEDQQHVEAFARQLGPLADRLVTREARKAEADPTRELRAELDLSEVIGQSPALERVLRTVKTAARCDLIVLLTGPSGTGKTALARVVHKNGPHARGPFIAINCAALPESLVESELFGAEKGSHSTATRRIEGKVTAAAGGTLFLDEVGELPPAVQAKLLQFVESKEYYPLGATKALRADARIIAATNADLKAMVEAKRFRGDLFYRLQEITMRVPSLAERPEDIPELMRFFCARCCEGHGLPALRISPGTLRAAEAAEWPGNIRELRSAVQRAAMVAAAEGALVIERKHLFPEDDRPEGEVRKTFQEATREYQGAYLKKVLEDTGWDLVAAAEWLDISRSHLYGLIKGHGLERKK